ncbi:unnamed protein product [Spirodela intermedia]|uniref:Uncharacterized protein n=1 Tax=Spirodela intermedia TaxID=51605 RepID=A0A7I8ITG0_SPIIN|nr:unnamed protein product [Spirodela intermedia]CAA6661302.1 unnamed protein product [Spirodela intermedia]
MEGEREREGKRKSPEGPPPICPSHGEGEEEETVKRFCELLESVREIRRRSSLGGCERRKSPQAKAPAWTPVFQWEDFAGKPASRGGKDLVAASPGVTAGGRREEEKRAEDDGSGLDLRLAL